MSGKPKVRTIQLDESFRPGLGQTPQAGQGTVRVSGYTPGMVQNNLAPRNTNPSQLVQSNYQSNYLRPSALTQGGSGIPTRQARELLLKPGLEARAETQNLKLSQQQKYSQMFRKQPENKKYEQADLNFKASTGKILVKTITC